MHNSPPSEQRQIFTVAQLNNFAKQVLEANLPMIWVEGELSNVTIAASGHWYFTLKDSRAQVRCAMFKGRNMRSRVRPQNGQKVLVCGRVSLYEGRGDYQLLADHMEDAGLGALQRQLDELKQKLQNEGLFNPEFKQPLPEQPKHIGVITSAKGAAIHDILKVLHARCPSIPVTIVPTVVQGAEAPAAIVKAIQLAEASELFDVLIVGRGGGSLEDLWAFNDEQVARAIFSAEVPIISAVGHESDVSIADLVADVRAATPSQAAELASPDQSVWLTQVQQLRARLQRALIRIGQLNKRQFTTLSQRLRSPSRQLQQHAQTVDRNQIALQQVMGRQLSARQQQLASLAQRLRHPGERLTQQQQLVGQLSNRLIRAQEANLAHQRNLLDRNSLSNSLLQTPLAAKQSRLHESVKQIGFIQQRLLTPKQERFKLLVSKLNTVSPLATLERGYAVVKDDSGKVAPSKTALKTDDRIEILFRDGSLSAKILDK